MVLDEYGGLVGLVTRNDLLEIIFGKWHGSSYLRSDLQEAAAKVPADGCYELDGILSLEEFRQITGCVVEEAFSETLGGLVFDHWGELPEEGQEVRFPGWTATVVRVKNNRIVQVRVCLRTEEPEPIETTPLPEAPLPTEESQPPPTPEPPTPEPPTPEPPTPEPPAIKGDHS